MKKVVLIAFLLLAIPLLARSVSAESLKVIHVRPETLTLDCQPRRFIINQIPESNLAPLSITVQFSGTAVLTETVPLDKISGPVAHYQTSLHPEMRIVDAWTSIYETYNGQFNLSCGPTVIKLGDFSAAVYHTDLSEYLGPILIAILVFITFAWPVISAWRHRRR